MLIGKMCTAFRIPSYLLFYATSMSGYLKFLLLFYAGTSIY